MNGYAIFLNDDGTETKLSWDELKLEENAEKYGYYVDDVNDKELRDCVFTRTEIKEINIPEGVEHIGSCGFENCKQLEKITLPSTLKRIENLAFARTAIKEIEIPESVEYVEECLFEECRQLEKITAPRGLYIDSDLTNIVERTNEIAVSLQDFYNNCEKNDIKLFKEEIDDLERGAFLIDFDENGNEEIRDFNDYADALKLKDSNGERYFTLFQLNKYYCQHQERYAPRFNYIEDQIEYTYYTDFKKLNDKIKQIVRFSEGLGIKPNLENDLTDLREQYIEKLETQNKANQAYLSKIEKEYNKQKSKETNNVELEKSIERD